MGTWLTPGGTVSLVVDNFSGTLTLDDGARVPVDLGLDGENLTLWTDGREIGSWPLKYCRVSPGGRGAMMLSLDGEKAVFEPEDFPRFSTVAAQRFRASSLADRINVIRDVPSAERDVPSDVGRHQSVEPGRRLVPRLGLIVIAGVALGLFGAAAIAVWVSDDSSEFAGTTITIPTTVAPPPPFFDQTLAEFATEWNLTAAAFGVPVQIRGVLVPGQFESQLTRSLTLQGRTDSDGTIASLVLVIDPSGDTEEDEIALSALGVAIAVANPQLESDERGDVLAALGLSVRNPNLEGLEGEVDVGGSTYSMTYVSSFNALLFTITPA